MKIFGQFLVGQQNSNLPVAGSEITWSSEEIHQRENDRRGFA
jgi:hypothetical protein